MDASSRRGVRGEGRTGQQEGARDPRRQVLGLQGGRGTEMEKGMYEMSKVNIMPTSVPHFSECPGLPITVKASPQSPLPLRSQPHL